MKKILMLDNYDSFTYNLVHYLEQHDDVQVDVYRNDKIELEKVADYQYIVLSPGPGLPHEAGILIRLIQQYAPTCKILGVCLGHQAIAEAFGGKLEHMGHVLHGVATNTQIVCTDEGLFNDVPTQFMSARYHSWSVAKEQLPDDIEITAVDEQGRIMALRHKKYDVRGVQFHPESVLTPEGMKMIYNWLNN